MSAKNHTKLSVIQRESLDRMIIDSSVSQQVVARCKIILLAAQGVSDEAISRDIGVHRHTCRRCRQIFVQAGLEGLWHVAAGRGRKKSSELHKHVIVMRKQTKTPTGKLWSTRPIAKAFKPFKVHASTVARILIQYRLLSSPNGEAYSMSQVLVPKFIEVVGAYSTPKERFLALLEHNSAPKQFPQSLAIKGGRIPRISGKNTRHFSATLVSAVKEAQDFVAKCSMSQRYSWSLLGPVSK